jgi:hypothetical protein
MHNSTNNPEMHQNPNYPHQKDLDVKCCFLKPTPFMLVPALLSSSICKIFGKTGLQRVVLA